MRRLLSIDPGLGGTGYVFWFAGRPLKAGNIYPAKPAQRKDDLESGEELLNRANEIYNRLMDIVGVQLHPLTVVIEFPEYQEGLRGRTARSTGSIDKLAFLIGVLAGSFGNDYRVIMPRVRDWKGQLPKEVVTRRMLKHYGLDLCVKLNVRAHAWDALGIGHWAWKQEWMR